jgi:hypothetical protein
VWIDKIMKRFPVLKVKFNLKQQLFSNKLKTFQPNINHMYNDIPTLFKKRFYKLTIFFRRSLTSGQMILIKVFATKEEFTTWNLYSFIGSTWSFFKNVRTRYGVDHFIIRKDKFLRSTITHNPFSLRFGSSTIYSNQ